MRTTFKKELPLLIVLLIPLVFLAIKWNELPEQLPMHWNLEGEIDGYGPKYLTPLLSIGIYLLLLVLPMIDPRGKNFDKSPGSYYKIRFALTLFFSAFTVVTILIALGMEIRMERFVSIAVSLLFIVMGNYMSTVRPNYFFGIRTPWTLDNEEVWKRTHLLGGRLWFWGGLACLIAAFTLGNEALAFILTGAIIIMSLVPIIYSFVLFRKLKNSHQ
jgi:uncharacterized membrane protein